MIFLHGFESLCLFIFHIVMLEIDGGIGVSDLLTEFDPLFIRGFHPVSKSCFEISAVISALIISRALFRLVFHILLTKNNVIAERRLIQTVGEAGDPEGIKDPRTDQMRVLDHLRAGD